MWSAVLKEARGLRQSKTEGSNEFMSRFGDFVIQWNEQLSQYLEFLSQPNKPPYTDTDKALIVETRAALRFGLTALAVDNEDERKEIQMTLVRKYKWHSNLTALLSQESGDSKCRVLASKLLSNLVTSNSTTSQDVVSSLAISPSEREISQKIGHTMLQGSDETTTPRASANWVNMLVSSSRGNQRESLGCLAAGLHNCLAALTMEQRKEFAEQLATDTLLVGTLLRNFISANSLQSSIGEAKSAAGNEAKGHWDTATEWIHLLVGQLIGLGVLPQMFLTLSSSKTVKSCRTFVPEQTVLFHCAVDYAQAYVDAPGTINENESNPFGGSIGWDEISRTYTFLVDVFVETSSSPEHSSDESNMLLARSMALSSLQILSLSLGVDGETCTKLRQHLGKDTELMYVAAQVLGQLVDEVTNRSNGLKARELKMTEDEQKWMTGLVRLLGNICFRCPQNQNHMRHILVPNRAPPAIQELSASDESNSRTALHVVLSCTSFATACFTLREWSVVAIRNILEDNSDNQQLVAALDAQTPIQSAALDHAGVRVKMDHRGKVTLAPLNEEEPET